MPSLLDAVTVIAPDDADDPEDFFAAAQGFIFPDDAQNLHGDPGATIVYHSPRFGDIKVQTADPEGEDQRRLFAHYLWNAGIRLAHAISDHHDATWSVKGHHVIELGAGVGLDGIVAVHAGAEEVAITDYPAKALVDNLRRNVERAVPVELASRYRIAGYEWGDVDSSFATENAHRFTRILAADCFWMPHEHGNLVRSMLHFLHASADARVLAIAGFHTGRANLAAFFSEAASQKLVVDEIYEEDSGGLRRAWSDGPDGAAENVTERKRCKSWPSMRIRAKLKVAFA